VHVLPVYGLYDLVPREVVEEQEAHAPPADELVMIAGDLAAYLASHP